jgi:nucleoid DNA-binding protein
MLSQTQKNFFIDKINEKVDLPLLGERAERALLEVLVGQIDRELENTVPPQYIAYIENPNLGMSGSDEAISFIRNNLSDHLLQKLNFGMLGNAMGKKAVELFVEMLVEAMRKGKSIS